MKIIFLKSVLFWNKHFEMKVSNKEIFLSAIGFWKMQDINALSHTQVKKIRAHFYYVPR